MGAAPSVLLAMAVTMGIAPGAHADDPRSSARHHYARGVELAAHDSYAEALSEFNRAYEISPHFSVLYNVGQTYVALDRPVQAMDALSRYLKEGGDNVPPARRREVADEIARQRTRIGEIEIATNVDGATISIDGEEIGRAPLTASVRLAMGEHRVSVATDGRPTVEKILRLAGEEQRKVEILLPDPTRPKPSRGAAGHLRIGCAQWRVGLTIDGSSPSPLPLGQLVEVAPGAHRVRFLAPDGQFSERTVVVDDQTTTTVDCGFARPGGERRPPPSSPSSWRSTLGYAVGGAGLAFSVAALAHFAWNLGRYETWQSNQSQLDANPSASDYGPRQQTNDELKESLERASRVTVVLAIAGVAGVGTGTWLLFFDRRASADPLRGRAATLGWRGEW